MIQISREAPGDANAREALLDRAMRPCRRFKPSERLRRDREPADELAFVARCGGDLIGSVRLWNVDAGSGVPALLLGPLAVDPAHQDSGLGSALMTAAIAGAETLGHRAILLVGDAPYYARFGFSADHTRWLEMPAPVLRDRFLGLELKAGVLSGARGKVVATGRWRANPSVAEPVSLPLAA
jgi:predicted N-acetyltransferase YhbS